VYAAAFIAGEKKATGFTGVVVGEIEDSVSDANGNTTK
jgi:hypothetical protein